MATSDEIAKESLDSWSAIADHWDDGMGQDGNVYWNDLEKPCLERLLTGHLGHGRGVLDLATGNGLCARWLASSGACVVAADGAPEMLRIAKERSPPGADISYYPLDMTNPLQFEQFSESILGEREFDAVVMNMAIMDVATLQPLAQALPRLLKKDGVFVATLLHPVFHTSRASRNIEIRDDCGTGDRELVRTMVLRGYLDVPPWKGWAQPGQPTLHYYFHRPLHELFHVFFKAGLVMDALEEPGFSEEYKHYSAVSSKTFTQFPPILAFRLRRAA